MPSTKAFHSIRRPSRTTWRIRKVFSSFNVKNCSQVYQKIINNKMSKMKRVSKSDYGAVYDFIDNDNDTKPFCSSFSWLTAVVKGSQHFCLARLNSSWESRSENDYRFPFRKTPTIKFYRNYLDETLRCVRRAIRWRMKLEKSSMWRAVSEGEIENKLVGSNFDFLQYFAKLIDSETFNKLITISILLEVLQPRINSRLLWFHHFRVLIAEPFKINLGSFRRKLSIFIEVVSHSWKAIKANYFQIKIQITRFSGNRNNIKRKPCRPCLSLIRIICKAKFSINHSVDGKYFWKSFPLTSEGIFRETIRINWHYEMKVWRND